MQVNTTATNYQALNAFQKPEVPIPPVSTLPVPNPESEASPEEKLDQLNSGVDNLIEANGKKEESDQAQRNFAAGVISNQSKKTQVEIYIAVALDSKTDVNIDIGTSDTINTLESLRDVQKQNNAVAAYATYQENQNSVLPTA